MFCCCIPEKGRRRGSKVHPNIQDSSEGGKVKLDTWLDNHVPSVDTETITAAEREPGTWIELRLFISSTFVDTQAERDALVKRIIPSINRQLAPRLIRIVPVDLRWGVLAEESKDCRAIQKTCLNQVDKCRKVIHHCPWFLGIRTERYGWIQNDLMPSEGFENPHKYEWINKFGQSGKDVSITSLECIHASCPPEEMRETPTVFFYERQIENPNHIEHDLSWVFDFEYVSTDAELDAEVQYQYVKTDKASVYKEDKKKLDEYLQRLHYVKWSTYKCKYRKGGARFTCKNVGKKSFGVGYVHALSEFEEKVESDLLGAIDSCFLDIDDSGIPDYISEAIQHENAIKLKASIFVGREDLFNMCWRFCADEGGKGNVLILHGEPGCGKSGLLAAVSQRCLTELREEGEFVFVHAVDSCPGSNVLEMMMKRLQLSLRKYRKDLGEINLSQECPQSSGDLKNEHLSFLIESAEAHPDKRFVIIVDAVNQFHQGLQAWKMWWLPSEGIPENLLCMITTLNEENGTFKNACEVCPHARKVAVELMSYEDRQEMVASALSRFNKKLTTEDHPFLGNQMQLLLSKSKSPLYLIAAAEALRKFGIFEKVSEYISTLPNGISTLFSFLLDEWAEEYGKGFTEDVAGLLCISRDGLLENEINDLLLFKESKEGFLYDSSFSRLYDSLCSFLAAGGGGFLRFFHDQLKYEVRRKFVTSEIELKLNKWISDFFLSCIRPQLCEEPEEDPPAYYNHALQVLLYHQLASIPKTAELGVVKDTLRNIYFVRERVKNQQQQSLNQEYLDAIERSSDQGEIKAFKQWAKFAQLYSPFITEFPEFCYNMAVNQAPTSTVAIDTNTLTEPKSHGGYPLYWSNLPSADDAVAVRYSSNWSSDCVASTPERNICCIASQKDTFVYEQSSGAVLQKVNLSNGKEAGSVYLSTDGEAFWIGNDSGCISVRNIETGTEECVVKIDEETSDCVIWMRVVGEYVACGTGLPSTICWDDHKLTSTIALIDEKTKNCFKRWSTDLPCYCYCFDAKQNIIFSGHQGIIKGWSLTGDLVKELPDAGECVFSLCSHPVKEMLVSGSQDHQIRQWNITTQEVEAVISDPAGSDWYFGGNWVVLYDHTGERILTTNPNCQSIRIYMLDGTLQTELKGHSESINRMYLVPGRGEVVTVGRDGSRLFVLPAVSDVISDEGITEEVVFCGFLPGAEEFVTLAKNALRIWTTSSCNPRISVDLDIEESFEVGGLGIHPNGKHICVGSRTGVSWYDTLNLEELSSYEALYESDGDGRITAMKISPNGQKLVFAECRNHSSELSLAYVYDNDDIMNRSEPIRYRGHKARIFSCDIHSDSTRALTGSHSGVHLWNILTGELINIVNNSGCFLVKFVPGLEQVLYDDGENVYICDYEGVGQKSFFGHTGTVKEAQFVSQDGSQIMTCSEDGSIRIFDMASEECLYAFVNHRAQDFKCFAAHPSNELVIAGNENSLLYILKTKRE